MKRMQCLYADNWGRWRTEPWSCRLLDRECRGCRRTQEQIDRIAQRIRDKEDAR